MDTTKPVNAVSIGLLLISGRGTGMALPLDYPNST